MGRTILPSPNAISSDKAGPLFIALGLTALFAATWLPAVPVVTAMAILTLGATLVTLARFGRTPALVPIVILHAAGYAALYGLFIGATLHADASAPGSTRGVWPMLDIAISMVPMAVAFHHVLVGLRQQFAPER